MSDNTVAESGSVPNTDIINQVSGAAAEVAALRARRPDALANAQRSFSALLEPETPAQLDGFSQGERYAVAAFVAGISQAGRAAGFYADLLADEADDALVAAVSRATARALASGLASGPRQAADFLTHDDQAAQLGARLAAAFDFAHLLVIHPKDASPAAIGHLHDAGWSEDGIVSLAQLIAFLSFQLRVMHGLAVLSGAPGLGSAAADGAGDAAGVPAAVTTDAPGWRPHARTLVPEVVAPAGFVNHSLGWKPWVEPLAKDELSEEAREALIRPERADSEYFRLLARDPQALRARTLTDLDIFYNTDGGLGRAERELAATVVSRINGCEYCASVHQARSKQEGGDAAAIDRLLFEGPDADLGSELWNVLRDASRALTHTPFEFNDGCVRKLRGVGLDDLAIIDFINSASFFNWANRLMLTLGEPDVPRRFRG